MRRIIALYLPLWPIERHRNTCRSQRSNTPQDEPFALWNRQDQTQYLLAVCPSATAIGLSKGMTLAEARAIHPGLTLAPADLEADRRALEKLARWLVRYSPLIGTDGDDGVLIDATGCTHLFGGEPAMLAEIRHKLASAGITAHLAMAENRAAAWALARYRAETICNTESSLKILSPLPVQALALDQHTSRKLIRLGLKTIGSLLDQPRPSLARRFRGHPARNVSALLTRLDQLTGKRDDPLSPLGPLPEWQIRHAFADPVVHLETITHATEALLKDLCLALARAEQGVRRLQLSAYRVDGSVQDILIGTARASREEPHLMRLLREKLDTLQADFGFDLLVLAAPETECLAPAQIDDTQSAENRSLDRLLDRLTTRLGPSSVSRIRHHASHLPERAQTFTTPDTDDLGWGNLPSNPPPRPIRLLPRPEAIDVLAEIPEGAPKRFRWRRMNHQVIRAEGPERLASEWWLDPTGHTRDYYRIEVETGSRFWLFRHGLYPVPGLRHGETLLPCWYLHGFFA